MTEQPGFRHTFRQSLQIADLHCTCHFHTHRCHATPALDPSPSTLPQSLRTREPQLHFLCSCNQVPWKLLLLLLLFHSMDDVMLAWDSLADLKVALLTLVSHLNFCSWTLKEPKIKGPGPPANLWGVASSGKTAHS